MKRKRLKADSEGNLLGRQKAGSWGDSGTELSEDVRELGQGWLRFCAEP